MSIAVSLHVIFAVIWVGGMFLAYVCVRPAMVEVLEPPQRLKLWTGIFRRFFPWVWAAVIVLFATGFYMIGKMGAIPIFVHVMALLGVVMTLIFVHIWFAPFRRLKRAVAAEDWKAGGAALNQIRILVATNLALGLLNVAVAMLGRWLLP